MQLYQIIILLTLHWLFEFALCKSQSDSHGNTEIKSLLKHFKNLTRASKSENGGKATGTKKNLKKIIQ